MRSPGREIRIKRGEGIGPPTYNVWVEGEPTHEKQGVLGQKSERIVPWSQGREAAVGDHASFDQKSTKLKTEECLLDLGR